MDTSPSAMSVGKVGGCITKVHVYFMIYTDINFRNSIDIKYLLAHNILCIPLEITGKL